MKLTKEQIEAKLDEMIDQIVDAERDAMDSPMAFGNYRREECKEVRKRVMDTLVEIYIDR